MILAKAGLRVSLFGGGSDMPEYFKKEVTGGTVISSTIDKFVHVAVNRTPNKHIKVSYNDTEIVTDVNDLKHDRIREALKLYDINSNIEISSFADIPSAGSGLGSSSSFTVALLLALQKFKQQEDPTFKRQHFYDALKVEIDLCKNNIGWQDQAAACAGGFNRIDFEEDHAYVTPFNTLGYDMIKHYLVMFRIGNPRDASEVLSSTPHPNKHDMIKQLVEIARAAEPLIKGYKYEALGELMHESWLIKRQTNALVTNDYIDEVYEHALKNGAWGGKICGAGSAGHLLFMVPVREKDQLITSMEKIGLEEFPFTFSYKPSMVVYSDLY